jgi:hypothetical protein
LRAHLTLRGSYAGLGTVVGAIGAVLSALVFFLLRDCYRICQRLVHALRVLAGLVLNGKGGVSVTIGDSSAGIGVTLSSDADGLANKAHADVSNVYGAFGGDFVVCKKQC